MKPKTPFYINMLILLSISIFSFYVFLDGKINKLNHPVIIYFLIIYLILFLIQELIDNIIYNQKFKFLSQIEKNILINKNKKNYFIRLYESIFNIPENEQNIEKINHDFDGIIELNNKLPSWWLNLFYLSIIFSLIYFFAYIFTDFAHIQKEYEVSYKEHIAKIQAYEKNRPQVNLLTAKFNKDFIDDGKRYFEQICATCHNIDGGGNTGPNLTDDYWINIQEQNLFKNIYSIIWNGSKNNATMRAFGANGEIKGNDIEKIASYVVYINKNPKKPLHGKQPQGKKIIWNK